MHVYTVIIDYHSVLTEFFQSIKCLSVETGMCYQSWRQQWRLLKAMEMLCDGWSLSQFAQQLDFVSDSAFIAFFRQYTGTTPARYLRHSIAEYQVMSSV